MLHDALFCVSAAGSSLLELAFLGLFLLHFCIFGKALSHTHSGLLCAHSVLALSALLSSDCRWLCLHGVPASDASPTLGFASVLRQFHVKLPALPHL